MVGNIFTKITPNPKELDKFKGMSDKNFEELIKLAWPDLLSAPKLREKYPLLIIADPAGFTAIELKSPPSAPKAPLIELNLAVPWYELSV